MPTSQLIESFIVFGGVIAITGAAFLYVALLKNMELVKEHIDKTTAYILKLFIVLMFLSLTCYSFIGASLFAGTIMDAMSMIWVLLFLNSIFLIIGMITQIRLANCIYKSNLTIIHSLINAIETRDENLKGHSMHVMTISLLIYDKLPKHMIKQIDRQKFEFACLMHDFGKLGIPESILNKPSNLTDSEWMLIKEHPKIGTQIIKDLNGFAEIKEWILNHHERMDGKGYYGLSGDEIPLASRILCIADAYSALVMNRLYKKAKSHDEAIEIMAESSGTQFDPELFDIFKSISESEIISRFKELLDNHQDIF